MLTIWTLQTPGAKTTNLSTLSACRRCRQCVDAVGSVSTLSACRRRRNTDSRASQRQEVCTMFHRFFSRRLGSLVTCPSLEILYEDNHCLAIAKPSGAVSAHFTGREQTLDRIVKDYLKKKHQKPGNVFLGVVHRL